MSARKALGALVVSLPFFAFTGAMAWDIGWLGALVVWLACAGIFGCIVLGVRLLDAR